MIYFTSDLHFYHPKNPHIGKRSFETSEEKDCFLIKQWNSTIGPDDEVYMLGDVSEGNGEETNRILRQLTGKKYLVIGNNDHYLEDPSFDKSLYLWCQPYYELLTMDTKFVLFHFPIEVWSGCGKDRIHLHGHCHSHQAMQTSIRRYEVGIDAHDGRPVSITEIWDKVKNCHNKTNWHFD